MTPIDSFMNQNAWKKFENAYNNLCFAHFSGMHQHSLLHVDWKNCGVNFQNSRNLKHESYCKTVWLSDSFSKVSVALLWILLAKRESFRMLFLAKWYFFTKIVMTYSEKKTVLAIVKNFLNSKLMAKHLQKFWDH